MRGSGGSPPPPGTHVSLRDRPHSSASLQDMLFKGHDLLEHRRLLWHGTTVAVVAAILKSGLRITPQAGGRLGKGIYFTSENSKSACYSDGPATGRAAWDACRVYASPAAFADPLAGSGGHAKPLPCCGSRTLRAGVAWAQPHGNARAGAIISIPFSHSSGLHVREGQHHVPDGGGPGRALPCHLRRPHAVSAARRLRQRPGLQPDRAR